ncbi:hypothetical protein GCM10025865_16390 [Paraoerskovia sediminicola]|uniref:DUF5926 domain-containing protein n=1 Tax=Paraoerskovia sediminicola TaxID=1138587 RepID=A0ABN6XCC9_9CELL|nr:DUF5926 family protein [Paraoerskovia sediminicola]BDZ42340.1 hypothetical protein GCM10025865_16390 [Paraoerskovia sediminicola]
MAKNSTPDFVLRPFEGIPGETDLVAMREVVPAATAPARTTEEYGSREVLFVTVLPEGWSALHRTDGVVLVALQTLAGSGDASRDLADVLLEALDTEPGTSVQANGLPGAGPRLQDVLDLSVPFVATVHEDFGFWLDPSTEKDAEMAAALEESSESIIPTVKLDGVESAYWCSMSREFLRWAFPYDEDVLIDAIARLHAKRDSGLGTGKFIGAFRSSGILVPVWEFPRGTQADELEEPAVAFRKKLDEVLAIDEPLDANGRRARAGIVARQVTLR